MPRSTHPKKLEPSKTGSKYLGSAYSWCSSFGPRGQVRFISHAHSDIRLAQVLLEKNANAPR